MLHFDNFLLCCEVYSYSCEGKNRLSLLSKIRIVYASLGRYSDPTVIWYCNITNNVTLFISRYTCIKATGTYIHILLLTLYTARATVLLSSTSALITKTKYVYYNWIYFLHKCQLYFFVYSVTISLCCLIIIGETSDVFNWST